MFMNVLLVIFILAVAIFVAWKISPVKAKQEIHPEPLVTIEPVKEIEKSVKKPGAKRGPKKKVQD